MPGRPDLFRVGGAGLAFASVVPGRGIVMAIQFTLGSVVVAAMAASSSDLASGRCGRCGGYSTVAAADCESEVVRRISRMRLMFMMIPLLIILTRTGPDFSFWQELLLAIGYMLSVSAAATSLGVAMFTWFRRSRQAALVAMLTWGWPIIPWLRWRRRLLVGRFRMLSR